jgi:putative tryptophan/tyrosine transport system substrate-binding protein
MERRGSRLSRRELVLGAGAAGLLVGCGRLPGQRQSPAKIPRIGVLNPGSPARHAAQYAAFLQRLRELGYVEGQNIILETRYADDQLARRPVLVDELVSLPVDVLVANSAVLARPAQQATTTIPIVVITGDPVGGGLVASFAHPGGNITGLSNVAPELAGKRLELLKQAVPGVGRVAVIWNQADQTMGVEFGETHLAAELLGVQLQSLPVREQPELERAYEAAVNSGAEAVVLITDQFITGNRPELVALSAQRRLPTISGDREFPGAGGLMAYGPNLSELWSRAASYVDKILKGTKPADLPVERPMRFDFVVNLKTAQALGITFPHEILLQVTEVIQ